MAADWVTDVTDGLSVIHGRLINNGQGTTNSQEQSKIECLWERNK